MANPRAPRLDAGFPNGPIADENGQITAVWRLFLVALYTRTGSTVSTHPGAQPGAVGVSSADNAAAVAAEAAARIAAQAALSAALSTEATARSAADTSEEAARKAADAILAQAVAAETVRAEAAEAASIRWLLLVNGSIPVGLLCDPAGVPVYVAQS